MIDVKQLTDKEIFSKASMYNVLLYLTLQDDSLKHIPNLYHLMGKKFIDFLKLYGGQTIELPTIDDLTYSFWEFEVFYDKITTGKNWGQVAKKHKLSQSEIKALKNKFKKFCVNSIDLPKG